MSVKVIADRRARSKWPRIMEPFLGTTDGNPLIFKTNAIECFRVDASGNLGIGTANPKPKYKYLSARSDSLFNVGIIWSDLLPHNPTARVDILSRHIVGLIRGQEKSNRRSILRPSALLNIAFVCTPTAGNDSVLLRRSKATAKSFLIKRLTLIFSPPPGQFEIIMSQHMTCAKLSRRIPG